MRFLEYLTRERQTGENVLARAEELDSPPPTSKWAKGFGGIICPLAFFCYGIWCCVTREATFFGDNATLDLHGKFAVAMGVSWLSIASFLHTYYFWGNDEKLARFSDTGKALSIICFIISYVAVVWLVLIDG
jgi:hypothetical protein